MTSRSDPLAATLHTFRAVAFNLPPRLWGELPEATKHQWRLIAVRIKERLEAVGYLSGRDCFRAWSVHLYATWEQQPAVYQARWNRMAALVNQALLRRGRAA